MIGTVMRIGWLTLKRDRIAQALSFVLPVVFFSVFVVIFGGMGPGRMNKVALAVVDEDGIQSSSHPVDFEAFFISFFDFDFCLVHHLDEVRGGHIPS